jgi:hypothetical protein
MRVYFQVFRSAMASWASLFQQAADAAARVGPERLISISHSEDHNDGVVTVWYWGPSDDEESTDESHAAPE